MKSIFPAVVAVLLLIGACSSSDGNQQAYCDALTEMLAAQPPSGTVTDAFEADMLAYAASVRNAAELAPDDHQEPLSDFAKYLEALGTDPSQDGLGDGLFALIGAMARIQDYATAECGIDASAFGGTGPDLEAVPEIRTDVTAIDDDTIAAVNALVPAGVDLVFESVYTTDDDEPTIALVPAGWESKEFFGTQWDPDDESGLGFFTEMSVGAHCDGFCTPRDWSEIMDDTDIGPFQFLDRPGEVLLDKELAGPEGRLIVYSTDTTIHPIQIVATRWDDRADHYFRCEVDLDEDDVDLWPVFAAACEASIPLWIPAA